MQALRFLFSPSGRLPPQAFSFAAVAVYARRRRLAMADHTGFDPARRVVAFVAAQIIVTWIWFALHAKRLRDAGRSIDLPAAIALLYALSVALLVIVAVSFVHSASPESLEYNGVTALGLILFVSVIVALLGSPQFDVAWLVLTALTAMALLPVILAIVCTLWAATRPSVASQPA